MRLFVEVVSFLPSHRLCRRKWHRRVGGGTGAAADVSLGSDSDSATGAGGTGSATGGGGKKVKLNKLGGNKNVTLKR